MKLFCVIAIAAATAIACGPGATDSHNSSQSGASARGGVAGDHEQPVTLSGCLQNADRADENSPTGTTGSAARRSAGAADQMAAGRGSPGERYTLTHAVRANRESDSAAGSRAAAGGSYVLEGNLEALREHVNRQVRVTGTLDTGAANTAGPQRVRVDAVEPAGGACAQR